MRKKPYLFLTAVILIASCNTTDSSTETITVQKETGPVEAAPLSAPFSRGVNFSGWFETNSAQAIPFTKYSEKDFADVRSLGADVIRLPIKMHSMTDGPPNYRLDPLLLKFLDTALNWAEKYGLYIIIDNHSFDPVLGLSDDIDKILLPVWTQVAGRYKDRGNFVVYEILNEPHGISDERWGEVQGMAINAIRRIDQKHAIIVGGTDYNSIGKLSALPVYTDKNLIYTFHFYDPYLFTHQGADWGGPPVLKNLAGVPFPADDRRMPKIPADLKGTWIERSLRYSYAKDSLPSALYSSLNKAVSFSKERNVPIFCGEFGVYMINSLKGDRVRWYDFTADALDRRNISRTSWDYYGGFGVFIDGYGDFNTDLNTEVVSAMGFTPPPQKPRGTETLKTGFTIYDDYPNRMFSSGFWGEDTDFSLYDTNTAHGEFAIRWGNADRYNIFWFNLGHYGDLSGLASSGYSLEFYARAEKPVNFDVRFVNEEGASSVPWRMRYTIDESNLAPDGKWHIIRIPLAQMSEQGAWINATQKWVSPEGKFSWKKVKQLEFVAEHSDMKGLRVWFDDIKIVK
jgi:endoglucanase